VFRDSSFPARRFVETAVMTDASLKLLVVDDDRDHLKLVKEALRREGLEIETADSAQSGWDHFHKLHPRIVLLDLVMPDGNGMDLLERMIAADPGADVILMTGHYSTESAVEAIQKGACDYLNKPLDLQRLRSRVASLISEAEQRRKTLQLDHELVDMYQFEGIVSRSPLMLDVFAKIRRVAPHFRTVLITGATGTGKELVARALHRLSPSAAAQFVVCNCAALVDTLLESELFGHVRGAFTGAMQDKPGVFEYANGGTVFLDEIGELSPAGQAKLLRVLQDHKVQRVGSPAARNVDVRVVAATHRDLRAMIAENQFREDLYYRLAMVEISLPRLSERREDLPLLQRYFLQKFSEQYHKQISGITRRAQARMLSYPWPGNVREFENVIGNASMMAESHTIDIDDLPENIRSGAAQGRAVDESLLSLEELQKRHVLRVLERVDGNKARAAEILGIARATVYQLLSKWKVEDAADSVQ
jgi:DNA-binding NtrC family response regulator